MATEQVVEPVAGERDAYAGVLRFYELAKKREWQVRDLPWKGLPPIPEGKSFRFPAAPCAAKRHVAQSSHSSSRRTCSPARWPRSC